jgi:hypothetical protein
MDVKEVRHVGDVVDDVAAVGAFDEDAVPPPVGPLVAVGFRDVRNAHGGIRRIVLVVVPDEQQAAAHVGRPRPGPGCLGCALGVGDQLAAAVATPAPVVEGAGDLVALDSALRQVAAHVSAVPVEDLDVPLRVGERDQLGAESLNGVRLTVLEVLCNAQAVPAAGVSGRQVAGIDFPDADRFGVGTHLSPPTRWAFN